MNDYSQEPKLLEHEADGIKELDNLLPRWWVWLFYLTSIFAAFYLGYYHVFHLGKLQHALVATEQALALCEEINDVEGVVTYLGNLVEIHRQRGDTITAERFAERRARMLAEIKQPN